MANNPLPPEPLRRLERLCEAILLLLIVGFALDVWLTLGNRRVGENNGVMIAANRRILESRNDHQEKLLLDFMSRTVDRWEKLQRDNPQVRVPFVAEPLVKPHLEDDEMSR